MSQFTIAAIGEVLWDIFPSGPRFGGAPANFACSAAGIGRERVRVSMVSAVGPDELGQSAFKSLKERGVNDQYLATRDEQTGRVLVELDDAGVASYEFAENCAWDNLAWTNELAGYAATTDAVCFGTLGQRSSASRFCIQQFVSATKPAALRIFDINLRPPFYTEDVISESLQLANVLKLNDEELPLLAASAGLSGSNEAQLRQLAKKFQLKTIALSLGERGAILLHEGQLDSHPGFSAKVIDTVGAGDAYTAALAVGLLNNGELSEINRLACEIAAYVCSQPGATPAIPREFSA